MTRPSLRSSNTLVSKPAETDELDNDELRRRIAGAGAGLGYDRRDAGSARREPLKRMGLDVPVSVHDQVRIRAAKEGRTINSLVLECLARAGFEVPESELVADRRQLR